MVSILTVTKRNGWQELAEHSLASQTTKDFEWIIVHEPNVEVYNFESITNFKWVPAPPKTKASNLNASLNEGLKNCKGEYVLFYQDFIELQPTHVSELLYDCARTESLITTATINPDGTDDSRFTGEVLLRQITPDGWEANVSIAPMKILQELGGFDEEYDNGWSWDNVNLAERADLLGYKFYIDEKVRPQLHYHIKETELHPEILPNGEFHEEVMRQTRRGKRPIKLNYL